MLDLMPRVTSVTSRQSGQVPVAYARLYSVQLGANTLSTMFFCVQGAQSAKSFLQCNSQRMK